MRTVVRLLSAAALAVCCLAAGAAGPAIPAAGKGKPADVFGLTRVWSVHLTIPADSWEKMVPTRGGMWGAAAPGKGKQPPAKGKQPPAKPDPAKQPPAAADQRKPRGGFGYDFEYVKGDLEIDGYRLKDVAVRFKGNSSYATTSRVLKRPYKIDLDRFVKDQTFNGLRMLVLNNLVMDPTASREVLGYQLYRAAGVPASRTAFVQLTLTVPGKYDRELVGLYVLIEPVDRTFLDDRFGDHKGLLLKPERVGPLDYLGEDWKTYADRYRPKTAASDRAKKRLVELTRLVQRGDDDEFKKRIGQLLDVDGFLRYAAATVLLSSLDSFIGLPHNYYLYYDPKIDRFRVLPWDLDHAFGALTMLGNHAQLMDLSIRRPWLGRNRLVERLLTDEPTYKIYAGHLQRLIDTSFSAEGVKRDLAAITRTVDPIKEKERAAVARRGDNFTVWGLGMLMGRAPTPDTFAKTRVASVRDQLAGKSKGTVLANRFAPPPPPLQAPLVKAGDTNKDGKLSRDEAVAGIRALFKACDPDSKGELDQKALTEALGRVLPKPAAPLFGRPPPATPPATVARALVERAGKDGLVNEERLVAAVGKEFDRSDRNKDGQLDGPELSEALRRLLPPAFGRPGAAPAAPKAAKEAKK